VRPGADAGAKSHGLVPREGGPSQEAELSRGPEVSHTWQMAPAPRTFVCVSFAAHLLAGALVCRLGAGPAKRGVAATGPSPEAFFSGDTFEVPAREVASTDTPVDVPETPASHGGAERRATTETAVTASRGPSEGGGKGAGGIFGATNERASIDLATAFTRGFPQAASADPAWASAPYGLAGEAVIVLEIDDSGALVSSRVDGTPSAAFRSGLTRTLALIHARAFTAGHPVTRLHVTARVTPDQVHDGLHGDVFAIGGSFDAWQGSAFFALAIGRRIDVKVTETR
jgi:hypothetical protein